MTHMHVGKIHILYICIYIFKFPGPARWAQWLKPWLMGSVVNVTKPNNLSLIPATHTVKERGIPCCLLTSHSHMHTRANTYIHTHPWWSHQMTTGWSHFFSFSTVDSNLGPYAYVARTFTSWAISLALNFILLLSVYDAHMWSPSTEIWDDSLSPLWVTGIRLRL